MSKVVMDQLSSVLDYRNDADWERMAKLLVRTRRMKPGKWYRLNIRCTPPGGKKVLLMQVRRKVLGVYPHIVHFETPYGSRESYTHGEVALGLDKVPEGTEIVSEETYRAMMEG